jgi:hypothetical protein
MPKQEVLTADERLKGLPLSSSPAKLVSTPAREEHRAAGAPPFFNMKVESLAEAEVQTRLRPSCVPELALSPRSPSSTTPSTRTTSDVHGALSL